MLPPAPSTTLFPYTTLFRSSTASPPWKFTIFASTRQSPQETVAVTARLSTLRSERALPSLRQAPARALQFDRSEEHTSELQSRLDIVCRLRRVQATGVPASG